MSKDWQQSVEDLEQKAAASNEELAATLQELVYQVQPRTQLDHLLADLKYRAEQVSYEVMTTIDDARDGDEEARAKLIKAAAIGVGTVGALLVLRKLKRRHKR